MNKPEFDAKVAALSSEDYYQSPDFQCGQTCGYPAMLCVNWEQGKAWLQLNEFVDPCGHDISEFEKCCADFGIRNCYDIYDFNSLLEELGTEAVQNAALYEEDEDEGMGDIQ